MKNFIQKILVYIFFIYKEIVQMFKKSTKKLNQEILLETEILQLPATLLPSVKSLYKWQKLQNWSPFFIKIF